MGPCVHGRVLRVSRDKRLKVRKGDRKCSGEETYREADDIEGRKDRGHHPGLNDESDDLQPGYQQVLVG
jgi:hypothetical protein